MDLSVIKVDPSSIEEGEWINDIPLLGDIAFRVRGFNCLKARELGDALRRALPPQDRQRDGRTPTATAADRITNQILAEAVLIDWKNLSDGAAEIPFSPEKAMELLSNPALPAFREGVAWAASVAQQGRADYEAALLGNSKAP